MTEPLRFDRSLLDAGPLAGRIVAVFTHAALVQLGRGGPLLTLLHPSRDLVPFGVSIPWAESPPAAGTPVRLADRALWLGEEQFRLDGEGTELKLSPVPFSRETMKAHFPIALSHSRRERSESERNALKKANEALGHVVAALSTGLVPIEQLRQDIHLLVGTGFGSTPTGDDWLVGVAAAGHRMASTGLVFPPAWASFREELAAVDARATTPVSREMLRHAARGELPEALLHFVTLFGDPATRVSELRRTCDRLKSVGSQTGTDWIIGVLAFAAGVRAQNGGLA